jgi:hypothetical protein
MTSPVILFKFKNHDDEQESQYDHRRDFHEHNDQRANNSEDVIPKDVGIEGKAIANSFLI